MREMEKELEEEHQNDIAEKAKFEVVPPAEDTYTHYLIAGFIVTVLLGAFVFWKFTFRPEENGKKMSEMSAEEIVV
jgi:hypothetical protein